jgi:hypothetical protein
VKPREPRKKVRINARLRQDCGWSDARILDISRRGLMVRAAIVPTRGTYVEISRGTHRIVARVVWARDGRFGAFAQDPIDADAVARGDQAPPAVAANLNHDRRAKRRESTGEREERSRRRSRQLEFFVIAALGSGAALLAFDTVGETLSRPLSQIEASLAARS